MRILFYADATGQIHNCIAIAQQLSSSGHCCMFLIDESYYNLVNKYGFKCYTIKTNLSKAAKQAWNDIVNDGVKYWKKQPIEQLRGYIKPYYNLIVESSINANSNIQTALQKIDYDILCVDDVVTYPAIIKTSKPWVRIISCFETEIPDENIPPHLSGLKSNDDFKSWQDFYREFQNEIEEIHNHYNTFLCENNVDKLPIGTLLKPSPYLNLLLTPKCISYKRVNTLAQDKFVYLNAGVRKVKDFDTKTIFKPKYRDLPLIYLSYGSMGYADFKFTNNQLKSLNKTKYRVIASVGDEYITKYSNLADNIYLMGFAPQPSLIKQANIVVFHGGNNTFNEILYFGKPSIVLPFAWDGFNVATRIKELNLGEYIPRSSSDAFNLDTIITKTLNDKDKLSKLAKISKEIQQNPGPKQAARAIIALKKG